MDDARMELSMKQVLSKSRDVREVKRFSYRPDAFPVTQPKVSTNRRNTDCQQRKTKWNLLGV